MKNQILVQIGKRIRNARNDMGISQEELAFRSGLHRTYIGMLERGERNPTAINLLRVAKGLGIEPGIFMDGLEGFLRDEE